METVTLYAVVFTDDDDMTTEHSAHLTVHDAYRAGAELARRRWAEYPYAGPFPAVGDDSDAMDALRTTFSVRLEVEEIEISPEVLRAALAKAG